AEGARQAKDRPVEISALDRRGGVAAEDGDGENSAVQVERRRLAEAMRRPVRSRMQENFRKVSTLVGLPPPLRGRVGERGKPRARRAVISRCCANHSGDVGGTRGIILSIHHTAEQAAPLSLTLPRKGGGNPSARASLTRARVIAVTRAVPR